MARQALRHLTVFCFMLFALCYTSDHSDSSSQKKNLLQHKKDDNSTTTTTTTSTTSTTTTTATPKIFNLERFVADKIAAAVEEVEDAYKTRQEDGQDLRQEALTTDAVFPEGWSTPAAFPPLTTESSNSARDDPQSDLHHDSFEEYPDADEHDHNHQDSEGQEDNVDEDYLEDWQLPQDLMTTTDFASQMQKDHSTSYPQEEKEEENEEGEEEEGLKSSQRPFNEKLVNRPRWYILREIAEEKEQEQEEDGGEEKEKKEERTAESDDRSGWPQNRPRWDSSPDTFHLQERDYDDGLEDSEPSPREQQEQHEQSKGPTKKDKTGKEERIRHAKHTKSAQKKHGHRRKWKSNKKKRPSGRDCVGCTKHGATISQARKLHTQILKTQLLDKLRLVPTFKKRPLPPKLPDQVFPDPPQRDHTGHDDQYYAKPTQLLVFGRDLGPRHRLRKSGTGSYNFGVTGKVKGHVTSADLWVYKMKDAHDVHGQTLVITDLHFSKRRRLRERSLVARLDTHVEEGWVRFDVTRLVQRWLQGKTPASLQMLAIRCKTCHRTNYRAIFGVKSNFRPVLVVQEHREDEESRRERREVCDPNTRCCKFDLTVNFHDLGVYEIFHPRSIKTDYCFGFCERPDAYFYNHSLIIQRMRFGSYAPLEEEMFDRLRPCCVPVVLREASIMHYINDGLDTQVSVVPNLLVEKCGCA